MLLLSIFIARIIIVTTVEPSPYKIIASIMSPFELSEEEQGAFNLESSHRDNPKRGAKNKPRKMMKFSTLLMVRLD